ncbi:protein-tyrosine phosphatase family protein [Litorisediminicola beolgyonensis]|uniref:Protein phosphatase n=1 Tax=Litorisediminicola beolgyonensis TaxID=1173614 RepID=A0ABW3ZFA7_9RHOB
MTTLSALSLAGGILAIGPVPGATRDYDGDLDHILHWEPGLVVSLTSNGELRRARAATLGEDLQAAGIVWVHLPIEDYGTPDDHFMDVWPDLVAAVSQVLSGGGRVLLHCQGGCGRSGAVALRLMIALGEEPDTALERLRRVRPCAIETRAQMRWALAEDEEGKG